MSVEELKQRIHDAVTKTNDEDQLIRVLDVLESEAGETPDWHRQIVEERIADYEKNPDNVITYEKWRDEMKKKYGI